MAVWKDIPGYEDKYQASFEGQIRRLYKNKPPRELKPYLRKSSKNKWFFIKLTNKNGETKEITVHSIVALTFLSKKPERYVIFHKNKATTDNCAGNLIYTTKEKLGKFTGAMSKRQPVVKIDMYGEIADYYSSAREAGRKNKISGQTVSDRCNGQGIKRNILIKGFAYSWDKEILIKKTVKAVKNSEKDKLNCR